MSEPEFDFSATVPPELQGGVYANLARSWHSPHEFTIDFYVSLPPQTADDITEYTLVSRVKLPVTVVFDALRDLNAELTRYEERFGEIRRPEER